MSQRLVIFDGKSVFYRSYYAMSTKLASSEGVPTGGVYGFAISTFSIINKLNPDYVCVAWDKAKTNIRSRTKLYPQYKAQRVSAPKNFYDQIPHLLKFLKGLNWPFYELDDYEADDIMAALAQQAQKQNIETFLVSSDLDLLQVLDKRIKIYLLKGLGNGLEFDEAAFFKKYGLKVEQFIDLKALMGDSADNIPGVAGIGQKRATQLLQKYQTLDNIYQHLDEIPPSLKEKLISDEKMALLSRRLVTLMTDAPVKLDLKAMSITNFEELKLQQSLRELEFYSLLTQIPKSMKSLLSDDFISQGKFTLKKPKIIRHQSLNDLKKLNWQKPIFLHAYCQKSFGCKLVHLLATDDPRTLHIYSANDSKVNLKLDRATIYGYDTKQLCQVLTDLGVLNVEVLHDVQVADFLLNPLRRLYSLSSLTNNQLGYIGELDELEPDNFLERAPEIAAMIFKLRQLQEKEFAKRPQLKKLAQTIEWPFIPVLARIERTGMQLDLKKLKKLKIDFESKIKSLQTQIYDFAGETFNLNSPKQLSKVLYEKLKLPTAGIQKNLTAYSTNIESLLKLKTKFPIVSYILEWRELDKLQNTYIKGLLKRVAEDGRIYSELRLVGVATGRLSSNNPNLQNIPIKTPIGNSIRQVFVAPSGYQLINADYSQCELRLAAVLSQDKELIAAFKKDLDIHKLTASTVFGVNLDQVTKQQRYLAKTINFGVLYGQGPHSLSLMTGMSYYDAQQFIAKYFQKRPCLKAYQDNIRQSAEKDGYVETLFGRRRILPDINSSNYRLKEAAFRQAINMPIQGTEADLMKMAMIKLEQTLDSDCRQIMQVHDSILVECPTKKVAQTMTLMKDVMENIYPPLGINLKVDVVSGDNWSIF